jgi:chaperone modulatory protein CbpM
MNNNTRNKGQSVEMEILAEDKLYTFTEVCVICRLDESGLQEYLDYGVIATEPPEASLLRQRQLDRLLRAQRLQQDLELNHAGVALALELLDTIESLKKELSFLSSMRL